MLNGTKGRAVISEPDGQMPENPIWNFCRCCGVVGIIGWIVVRRGSTFRCGSHLDRNPCAIIGCRRTTKASRNYGDELWLCAEHWRLGCPARSRPRRAYNRIFQRAKRFGWSDELVAQYWRIWSLIIARARKRCAGDVDMNEVNKLFGWD